MNAKPATQPASATSGADIATLKQLVATDLTRVNHVITEQVQSDVPLIAQVASHLIAAGGKRLRPSLTLAASRLCGYTGDRHIRLAACVEFIHTATLLHDDVVDESSLRRGEATANAVWGNKSSVLVGDFLLSRAFQLMVADGSLDVLKVLSDAAAIIAAGEVQQLMASHDLSTSQATYESIIGAKTAALFAAACEIGALVAGKAAWRAPLRNYGYALGMTFQLVDDALDYAADEKTLGKAIGDDFRDGKVTMPVLLAYQHASVDEKTFWERCIEAGDDLTAADLANANRLLQKHRAFDATLARAETFCKNALDALEGLPECLAKTALVEAARFSLNRQH